jgi:hypothetical protein
MNTISRIFTPLASLAILLFLSTTPSAADDDSVLATGAFAIGYTPRALLGESADKFASAIPLDEQVTWEIVAPTSYDAKNPPGLLVFVSPTQSGAPPRGWEKLMDEYNLIWVSANNSGNKVVVPERVMKALLALSAIQQHFVLDPQRVYISGFSGGGKVASMITTDYAGLFKGGIFIGGVEPWPKQQPAHYDLIKSHHFVFLSGDKDFNLAPTKRIYREYKDAGITNSKLMVVNEMAHTVPRSHTFKRAIDYLDERIQ